MSDTAVQVLTQGAFRVVCSARDAADVGCIHYKLFLKFQIKKILLFHRLAKFSSDLCSFTSHLKIISIAILRNHL